MCVQIRQKHLEATLHDTTAPKHARKAFRISSDALMSPMIFSPVELLSQGTTGVVRDHLVLDLSKCQEKWWLTWRTLRAYVCVMVSESRIHRSRPNIFLQKVIHDNLAPTDEPDKERCLVSQLHTWACSTNALQT